MPRSNWGTVHKAIGVAVAGFILFCAFNIVWNESALRTEQRVKATDAAYDYAASADKEIRNRCRRLEAHAQLVCVTEAVKSSRQSQREEYDLVAQQQAARWTMIAGGAASFGLLLSIVGVGLVWTTFRETRRTAEATVRNYEAFVKFEGPMIDVKLERYNVYYLNDKPWVIGYFKIRNIGRSPAIFIDACIQGAEAQRHQCIIASGEELSLPDPFQFQIYNECVVFGYVEFVTAISPGKKRLFVMGFDEVAGGWNASIHPEDILEHDHPDYHRPFANMENPQASSPFAQGIV